MQSTATVSSDWRRRPTSANDNHGSWLISRRVNSAGALIRQPQTSGSTSTLDQAQCASSCSSTAALLRGKDRTDTLDWLDSHQLPYARGAYDSIRDVDELRRRLVRVHDAYDQYRLKSAAAISAKEALIDRIRSRMTSGVDEQRTTLEEERDVLLERIARMEADHRAERLAWETAGQQQQQQEPTQNHQPEVQQQQQPQPQQTSDTVGHHHQSRPAVDSAAVTDAERDRLQAELLIKQQQLDQLTSDYEQERRKLDGQFSGLTRRLQQLEEELSKRGVDEAQYLRQQLDRAHDYCEAVDIESEQQITSLVNQLEDMQTTLEQRQCEVTLLNNRIKELQHENGALQNKVKTFDSNGSRQKDVIEGLRDELDRHRDKWRDVCKERDDLLLRNASLSHETEIIKREATKQRDEIHGQLATLSLQLEQCKAQLRDEQAALPALANLDRKVNELEQGLRDRDATIRVQQQRLTDLKRFLNRELRVDDPDAAGQQHSAGRRQKELAKNVFGSAPLFASAEEGTAPNFQYLKNVIFRFVTSTDYEATQLVRAVAVLLRLSPEEEQLVWDTLRWKMSWLPASRP